MCSTCSPLKLHSLKRVNPQIKNANRIYPREVVRIPRKAAYVIQKGDTLDKIAKRMFRFPTNRPPITFQELARKNGIINADLIYAGHTLYLPKHAGVVIQTNDTLSKIASKFLKC